MMMSVAHVNSAETHDSGELSNLTEDERTALKKFMLRFLLNNDVPYLKDEQFMLKWLKARKFNLDKAEAFLRHHLRYRKALHMDEASYRHFEPPFVYQKYYTQGHFGYDKSGRPVIYHPYGVIDPQGILSSIKVSDALRSIQYAIESRRWRCAESSTKTGHKAHQIVYVLDLKGIGPKHLWLPAMEVFKQIAQLLEQHTPEIVHSIFVINAPVIFYAIYKLVRPILDENTQRKIKVFGENNWKEALLEAIPKDQLPAHFGGEAYGPNEDAKCSHKICWGGEVPIEFYFKESQHVLPAGAKMATITVQRGSELLLPVTVSQAGSTLLWYFKSHSSSDIGFAIYRQSLGCDANDTDQMEMVAPYYRLLTHLVPESGSLKIDTPGTYVVQLNNKYSWLTSKTFDYYTIVILAETISEINNIK